VPAWPKPQTGRRYRRSTIGSRTQAWLSITVLRWALALPTALFGVLSIATHGARFLRLTFREYAVISGLLALAVLAGWLWAWARRHREIVNLDQGVLWLVLAAGLAGAVLASVYRLPDMDDFAYVPDAVHFLTFPDERMGYTIHYGYLEGKPQFTIIQSTSQPFEYVQALAAGALGLDYLQVYYLLAVALAGFCVPLAIFLLLAHFADRTSVAALAMLIVVAILTLLGEGKNTPGSLSFTRIFQGKVVLIAGGLPLFTALSLDFMRRPSPARWLLLALAGAAMTGLSTTAFFLLPMLALCLGAAGLVADGWSRRTLATLTAYGASLGYVVGYAFYASRSAEHLLDASVMSADWPVTFGGHLALFLDLQRPVTPLIFLAALGIVAVRMRGRRRRFMLAWTAAALILFLNPVVAPFWIATVTSAPIYWRAFYALPLLAAIGMAAIALLERLPAARRWTPGVFTALILITCLIASLLPGSTSIYRRGGEIGWPAYKLVDEAVEVSRAVVSLAPPGVMLASREISGTTPMLRGGYPQMRFRDNALVEWLTARDRAGEADLRIRASEFTNGQVEYLAEFTRLVASTEVLETVVLREDVLPHVESFLLEQAFSHRARSGRYWILWR
jgi:hypothetical protein